MQVLRGFKLITIAAFFIIPAAFATGGMIGSINLKKEEAKATAQIAAIDADPILSNGDKALKISVVKTSLALKKQLKAILDDPKSTNKKKIAKLKDILQKAEDLAKLQITAIRSNKDLTEEEKQEKISEVHLLLDTKQELLSSAIEEEQNPSNQGDVYEMAGDSEKGAINPADGEKSSGSPSNGAYAGASTAPLSSTTNGSGGGAVTPSASNTFPNSGNSGANSSSGSSNTPAPAISNGSNSPSSSTPAAPASAGNGMAGLFGSRGSTSASVINFGGANDSKTSGVTIGNTPNTGGAVNIIDNGVSTKSIVVDPLTQKVADLSFAVDTLTNSTTDLKNTVPIEKAAAQTALSAENAAKKLSDLAAANAAKADADAAAKITAAKKSADTLKAAQDQLPAKIGAVNANKKLTAAQKTAAIKILNTNITTLVKKADQDKAAADKSVANAAGLDQKAAQAKANYDKAVLAYNDANAKYQDGNAKYLAMQAELSAKIFLRDKAKSEKKLADSKVVTNNTIVNFSQAQNALAAAQIAAKTQIDAINADKSLTGIDKSKKIATINSSLAQLQTNAASSATALKKAEKDLSTASAEFMAAQAIELKKAADIVATDKAAVKTADADLTSKTNALTVANKNLAVLQASTSKKVAAINADKKLTAAAKTQQVTAADAALSKQQSAVDTAKQAVSVAATTKAQNESTALDDDIAMEKINVTNTATALDIATTVLTNAQATAPAQIAAINSDLKLTAADKVTKIAAVNAAITADQKIVANVQLELDNAKASEQLAEKAKAATSPVPTLADAKKLLADINASSTAQTAAINKDTTLSAQQKTDQVAAINAATAVKQVAANTAISLATAASPAPVSGAALSADANSAISAKAQPSTAGTIRVFGFTIPLKKATAAPAK